MKLHDVPRNTWVKVDGQEIFFWHLDSPYAICSYSDKELDYKQSFLVYGSTDVEIINPQSDGSNNKS